MPYPKPLSEKTLEKRYAQSGLSAEVQNTLHTLFAACANLYGVITLRDAWEIWQNVKNGASKIRRSDLIAFSDIARREAQPYQIYDIDELYTEEKHNDLDRHIVSKELIRVGYGRLHFFYCLEEECAKRDYSYCIPDDFFSYAAQNVSTEENHLADFIGSLKSTANECEPKYGKAYPNENRGKRLNEFSFLNALERSDLEYYKKNSALCADMKNYNRGTEAEKIMRHYKFNENVGKYSITTTIQYMFQELHEVGVRLTTSQTEKLVQLVMSWHNGSRWWCLCGWKPTELAALRRPSGLPSISFGPGLQKAFAEGTIDKNELVKMIEEKGLKVLK